MSRVCARQGDLPSCLPQHLHHLGLENRVYGFDANACSALRHGEDVHDANGEVVDEVTEHETHDFHGDTGATVP